MTVEELIAMYGPDAVAQTNTLAQTDNAIVEADPTTSGKFYYEIGIHNQKDTLWRINEAAEKMSWVTYLEDGVGEFNFTFKNQDKQIDLKEGYNVGYWINGKAGFNGNIFKISQELNNKEMLSVTCLSYMRYLQNKGWAVMENKTASQIFDDVCTQLGLPHKIIDSSSYVCTSKNYFADTWYKPIQDAITETLANTGEYYIIQDNFGTLEFRNIKNEDNIKQIKFSEDSCIINGSFETSIENSFNFVVGYIKGDSKNTNGSNKEVEIASIAAAKDSSTIEQWGMLTTVEEVPKNTVASLQDYINKRLKFYNSPRKIFTLECMGVAGVIAGNIIWLEITDVVGTGNISGAVIVDRCTHNISNGKHTMELEVEIVQEGVLQFDITKYIQKLEATNE